MIRFIDNTFILDTKNTTYAFRINEFNYLEHLYYGKLIDKIPDANPGPLNGAAFYSQEVARSLEFLPLEYSSNGKSDLRQSMITVTYEDGSFTNDFVYDHHEILGYKKSLQTLPSSYGSKEELIIYLVERNNGLKLQLHYSIFDDKDFIVRSCKLTNDINQTVTINRLLSMQIDFDKTFDVTSFNGCWANEMNKHVNHIDAGRFEVSSMCGYASSRNNSFIMLSNNCDEYEGECYGFNIVYGGNHYEAIEVDTFGHSRLLVGINPDMFEYRLRHNESFEAPEVVFSYSDKGFNGLSENFHRFVNNHIVRGEYKNKVRPLLINSWEGNYFDINEEKIVNLAKAAKKCGIELLVMDDGWFKGRNDDHTSLGDWIVDTNKLPLGLGDLASKVNAQGLKFGIWVEPEMVSVDSDLYRAHPEWVIEYKNHSEGRNQRILDLSNPAVAQYIIKAVSNVLDSGNIEYIKWDCNRIFTDVYSKYLTNQKELMHRYYLSLYYIWSSLVNKYPHVLFEGCSSGGNRFDLATLCYFPQIWASDNTDAVCRKSMQNSYSYGYPQSCFTNHVSIVPNHQTNLSTSMASRFKVAMCGNMGYELDLTKLSEDELKEISKQVKIYKSIRQTMQFGKFERYKDGWLISDDQNRYYLDLSDVKHIDF